MPALRLEPAAPDDAAALASIFLRCWQTAYRGVVDDAIIDGLDATVVERSWRGLVDESRSALVVARVDGAACGMVRFGVDPGDCRSGHVFSLYVDPDAAGAGIGRALLAHAARELAASGRGRATLWVFAANSRALRFYGAAGWEPTGESRVEPEWRAVELKLAIALTESGEREE